MSKDKKPIDEEKTAAANYILEFYKEVALLKHNYANYINLLAELKATADGDDLTALEEPQKETLKVSVQALRYYVIQTYTTLKSIKSNLKTTDQEFKDLAEAYGKVKDKFIMEISYVEKYVDQISTILIKEVMRGLLRSSQEIFKGIYETDTDEK